MPQSLAKILLHLVFSTKERRPFLRDSSIREEMHRYIGGILVGMDCPPIIVGGVEDHVHLLCVLSRTCAPADMVKEVKRGSSLWIKTSWAEMSIFRSSIYFALTLLLFGCQHGPPKESGQFREADLVELIKLDPTLRLDIRYATTNNFLHRPVYAQGRAFLQRPAAEALVRAQRTLQAKGYGIVVFDGYRPWSVTKIFWDSASAEERRIEFVANPRNGSRHNRGCAVDLSLIDLKTGTEVEMPSGYDEFSKRAFPDYAGGTAASRALRDMLRTAMEAEGFKVYQAEWWHFDYQDWRQYRIMDVPFEAMGR